MFDCSKVTIAIWMYSSVFWVEIASIIEHLRRYPGWDFRFAFQWSGFLTNPVQIDQDVIGLGEQLQDHTVSTNSFAF